MCHCLRLLLSGKNILTNGEPIVRFEGTQLQYLKDIRAGKFTYEEIMADIEKEQKELDVLFEKSTLPWGVDMKKIDELYKQIVNESRNI